MTRRPGRTIACRRPPIASAPASLQLSAAPEAGRWTNHLQWGTHADMLIKTMLTSPVCIASHRSRPWACSPYKIFSSRVPPATSRPIPCPPTCAKRLAPSCRVAPRPSVAMCRPVPTATCAVSGPTPAGIGRVPNRRSESANAGWRRNGPGSWPGIMTTSSVPSPTIAIRWGAAMSP